MFKSKCQQYKFLVSVFEYLLALILQRLLAAVLEDEEGGEADAADAAEYGPDDDSDEDSTRNSANIFH